MLQNKLKERAIEGIEIKSAGTHAIDGVGPLPKVMEICKQRDIDISSHFSHSLSEELVKNSDIILVMENEQIDFVVQKFPEAKEKVKILSSYSSGYQGQDIKDPVGGSNFAFRTTFAILDECVKGLLDDVLKNREK